MVGAKVKEDVEQLSMFGDEDLPPKRKQQFVAKPDMLIEIPEPVEEEKADFDEELMEIEVEVTDYPDWQQILDGFDYTVATEITRVDIASVEGQILDGSGFREFHEAPVLIVGIKTPEEINDPVVLAELVKHSIRDIADNLLAEEGIGSHELGYLYGVLMDHVRKRMLNGKSLGTATIGELRHAINRRHQMAANFKNRLGLVSSIVRYKTESEHAN
jgi:hypothetical protein